MHAWKAQLRAPSTAEFSDEVARRQPDGSYEVTGAVNAQNGFGAMIRNRWTCTATPTDTGYKGLALILEP